MEICFCLGWDLGVSLLNVVVEQVMVKQCLPRLTAVRHRLVQRLEKDSPSGKDGLAVSACLVPAGPMVSWAAVGRVWPAA